jgi:hypothetical protein
MSTDAKPDDASNKEPNLRMENKRPTIAELDAILAKDPAAKIDIHPDGSVTVVSLEQRYDALHTQLAKVCDAEAKALIAYCINCEAITGQTCVNCNFKRTKSLQSRAEGLDERLGSLMKEMEGYKRRECDLKAKLASAHTAAQEGRCLKCNMGPLRESCAYPEACQHPGRELAAKLNQELLAHAETRTAAQAAARALQRLRDVQNGPPLIKYEKEWNEAMADVRKALADLAQQGVTPL